MRIDVEACMCHASEATLRIPETSMATLGAPPSSACVAILVAVRIVAGATSGDVSAAEDLVCMAAMLSGSWFRAPAALPSSTIRVGFRRACRTSEG
jgi:hypothetical protein